MESSMVGSEGSFKSHFDPVLFPPLSRNVLLQVPRRLSTRQNLSSLLEALVVAYNEKLQRHMQELHAVLLLISQRLNWAANSNKVVSVALDHFSKTNSHNDSVLKVRHTSHAFPHLHNIIFFLPNLILFFLPQRLSDCYKERLKHSCSLHNFELHNSDASRRNAMLSDFNKLLDRWRHF